jgi:hypothetical protein
MAVTLIFSLQPTLRTVRAGGGGSVLRRRGPVDKDEQNSVLAEIFKSNVALLQSLEVHGVGEKAPAPADGGAAPAPAAVAPEPAPAQQ